MEKHSKASLKSYIAMFTQTIERQQSEIKETQKALDDAVRQLTELCKHPLVFEGKSDVRDNFEGDEYTIPPCRVCMECGLAEEGWGCGYLDLADEEGRDVVITDRSKALQYSKLYRSQTEMNTLRDKRGAAK